MAKTDFKELAYIIRMEVHTRHNIIMHEANQEQHFPASVLGAMKLEISDEEIKNLAKIERIRNNINKTRNGGFYNQLIKNLEEDECITAKRRESGNGIVIKFIPYIDNYINIKWEDLVKINKEDMLKNKNDIKEDDEYASPDYRYRWDNSSDLFRDWNEFE